jgi:hypothetical protein
VDDAGEPEENAQDDVNPEGVADAAFKEDGYERKENRKDD